MPFEMAKSSWILYHIFYINLEIKSKTDERMLWYMDGIQIIKNSQNLDKDILTNKTKSVI